jgi:hypothetical protein
MYFSYVLQEDALVVHDRMLRAHRSLNTIRLAQCSSSKRNQTTHLRCRSRRSLWIVRNIAVS